MFQEVRACFFDRPPAGGGLLPAPTTIAFGERTTPASRAMSKALAHGRPNVSLVEMSGLSHMAPLTRAVQVHEELARHMSRVTEAGG
jgi:pimeloyl-ACP methyl ester carboxylesterase